MANFAAFYFFPLVCESKFIIPALFIDILFLPVIIFFKSACIFPVSNKYIEIMLNTNEVLDQFIESALKNSLLTGIVRNPLLIALFIVTIIICCMIFTCRGNGVTRKIITGGFWAFWIVVLIMAVQSKNLSIHPAELIGRGEETEKISEPSMTFEDAVVIQL